MRGAIITAVAVMLAALPAWGLPGPGSANRATVQELRLRGSTRQVFRQIERNFGRKIVVDSGLRKEGMLNSALMLTGKLTFGMGAFVAGITLEFAGLQGVTSIDQVTVDMQTRLAWVYGPGMSVIVLCGAYLFSRYRLNAARYVEIRAGLDKARAQVA